MWKPETDRNQVANWPNWQYLRRNHWRQQGRLRTSQLPWRGPPPHGPSPRKSSMTLRKKTCKLDRGSAKKGRGLEAFQASRMKRKRRCLLLFVKSIVWLFQVLSLTRTSVFETSKQWIIIILTLSQGWSAKSLGRACKGYRDPSSPSQAAQHLARLPPIVNNVHLYFWTNVQSTGTQFRDLFVYTVKYTFVSRFFIVRLGIQSTFANKRSQ